MANRIMAEHLTFDFEDDAEEWDPVEQVRYAAIGPHCEPTGAESRAGAAAKAGASGVSLGQSPLFPTVQAVVADSVPAKSADGSVTWAGHAWGGHSPAWGPTGEAMFGRSVVGAAGAAARAVAVAVDEVNDDDDGQYVAPRLGVGWQTWFSGQSATAKSSGKEG